MPTSAPTGKSGDATRSGNDIASTPTSLAWRCSGVARDFTARQADDVSRAAGRMTAIRPAQIEASLQRIGQDTSTPDDADLWRAVWDALQSIAKTLGIRADVLRSPDEAILMIQYQEIAPIEETIKE